MTTHQCPVCGVMHEVSAIRAQFAYGRQLACGCDCEAERRRRRRRLTRRWQSDGTAKHAPAEILTA